MEEKLSVTELSVENCRVLLRADLNVPLDEEVRIADDTRIRALLPTIRNILERGGSLVIMSHLGRPKGEPDPKLSLAPVARRLEELLSTSVRFVRDCVGEEVSQSVATLVPGELLLLENLRFHQAETKPELDPSFAKALASLGDCYVNDAFGSAHRAHSSIVATAECFPAAAAAGLLMEKELRFLLPLLTSPQRPFHAVIGGAKVSTKIGVLRSLVQKVDTLHIGGAMANTFLKALGVHVGSSLVEEEYLDTALEVVEACKQRGVPLILPQDAICSDRVAASGVVSEVVELDGGVPEGKMILDIGPATRLLMAEALHDAKTILWNGPLGVFEHPPFDHGTVAVAKLLSKLPATTVVGGGDSVAAIRCAGVEDKISHVSTGGGALLELLQYGHLPGIDVLSSHVGSVTKKR